MEKIKMRVAQHFNYTPPTDREFWEWPNRRRHEFIKRDFGKNFKIIGRNLWAYLFYPETDLCVRFQVDKKRQIVEIETYKMGEGHELRRLSETAIRAINNHN